MPVTLSSLAGAGAQFFDNNGVPLAGGLIYTYLAGTSTPAATYTSSTGLIAHANPIVLDAAGRIAAGEIWLTTGIEYKIVVKTSLFVQLGSYDNIPSINDFTTVNASIAALSAALANTSNVTEGDALIGFKQSNESGVLTGAVGRTVHQKLQEVISAKDFGAVGDGTTNDTAALQSAINAAVGKTLFIPAGNYKITSALNITTSTSITGEFSKTTILLATQNQNGIIVGDGTIGTRSTVGTISISNISFNPFTGVAAFVSGSCIYVNNIYNIRIVDCIFYGKDPSSTTILYNGVLCNRATGYYITNCLFQGLKNYGHSAGGTSAAVADQSIDGRIDFCTFIAIDVSCVYFADYCSGITLNCPVMYSFALAGITVNSFWGGTGAGINFFIFQPDIEVAAGATGISITNGNVIQVIGGWIGAVNAVYVGVGGTSVQLLSCSIQGQIEVFGDACQIVGCEITGLSASPANGITATTCNDLIIVGNRIRQWITTGIAISGVCPRLQITGNSFRNNGINITGDYWAASNNPAKITGNNGEVTFALTAASALTLNHGRYFYQATGATAIDSMTLMASETRLVIQAGVGGITINNSAAIYLKGSVNASVPAFACIEFMATGTNWLELSRNF